MCSTRAPRIGPSGRGVAERLDVRFTQRPLPRERLALDLPRAVGVARAVLHLRKPVREPVDVLPGGHAGSVTRVWRRALVARQRRADRRLPRRLVTPRGACLPSLPSLQRRVLRLRAGLGPAPARLADGRGAAARHPARPRPPRRAPRSERCSARGYGCAPAAAAHSGRPEACVTVFASDRRGPASERRRLERRRRRSAAARRAADRRAPRLGWRRGHRGAQGIAATRPARGRQRTDIAVAAAARGAVALIAGAATWLIRRGGGRAR